MRRFWGFYQNGSYSVGCNGKTVYIFDKAGKEIARFNDFPYAYSAAFMPGKNIIAVKSTGGVLGFYDLDSLSLLKKITVTKIGAQDEGFGFSTDGSFFTTLKSPFVQQEPNLEYMRQTHSQKSTHYLPKMSKWCWMNWKLMTRPTRVICWDSSAALTMCSLLPSWMQKAKRYKISVPSTKINMIIFRDISIGK